MHVNTSRRGIARFFNIILAKRFLCSRVPIFREYINEKQKIEIRARDTGYMWTRSNEAREIVAPRSW